jgi:hypothetical protein
LKEHIEIAVLASGPSMNRGIAERALTWRSKARERRIMVVNETWRLCPTADYAYAGDYGWFAHRYADARREFQGQFWSGGDYVCLRYPEVRYVHRVSGLGIPSDVSICTGSAKGYGNSGFQAVCLAATVLRAREIHIAGFDCGYRGLARHWHEDYINPLTNAPDTSEWRSSLSSLAIACKLRGIKVHDGCDFEIAGE